MKDRPAFYSQNFEDVLLARCFANQEKGFYIDVGAQHEEADSVTRYFYELGWSGINIEPVVEFAKSFTCRERDITICCAAGAEDGAKEMGISLQSGLSSFEALNNEKAKELGLDIEPRLIAIRSLNAILLELGHQAMAFEFLKIDVEGFELEVIKGIDLQRYRPRIILCEATDPNTTVKTCEFDDLCRCIEAFNYQRIYFDGLNQWWCAREEHANLAHHFTLPPGVFDSAYITPYCGTHSRNQLNKSQNLLRIKQLELTQALQQLQETCQELCDTQEELRTAAAERSDALKQLEAIHRSRSWKTMELFRSPSQFFRRLTSPEQRQIPPRS